MALWKPHLHRDAGSKYLGIVQALESDIYAGRVQPGDRLPSQRAIAEELQVDLTTVTRAFNEAKRRGLLEGNKGGGTYIRDSLQQQLAAEKLLKLDLSMNNPPQPAAANLSQRLSDGIAALMTDQRRMLQLQYQDAAGNPADRDAAASWLQSKQLDVTTDRLLIACGAQSALYGICKQLLTAGSELFTPEYTYPGLKAVAKELGITLKAIACDEEGIIPSAFEQACEQHAARALYLIPTIDNPTAVTIPLKRRQALAEIANRYQVSIIEDDPYSSLKHDAPTPFVALLPELTWHIVTLSKSATPALRVAFVVTPDGQRCRELASVLRASSLMAPPLMCALVTRWIYDGTLGELAVAIREENNQRQQRVAALLAGYEFSADPDGHHIWLRLPAQWQAEQFAREAQSHGVSIVPVSQFAITNTPIQAVRVSLGLALDMEVLNRAVGILSQLLAQMQSSERAVV
jgi:DNA-binding transcriptional MocR family regulator